MGGINVGRWVAGGVVAGLVMAAVVGASVPIAYGRLQSALRAKNLGLPSDPVAITVLLLGLTLIVGPLLVFYYAAARTRFGAGPKTAVIMAVAAWFGGPLISSVLMFAMGVLGWRMTVFGLFVDLVALVAGSLAGAAIYREEEAVAMAQPAVA